MAQPRSPRGAAPPAWKLLAVAAPPPRSRRAWPHAAACTAAACAPLQARAPSRAGRGCSVSRMPVDTPPPTGDYSRVSARTAAFLYASLISYPLGRAAVEVSARAKSTKAASAASWPAIRMCEFKASGFSSSSGRLLHGILELHEAVAAEGKGVYPVPRCTRTLRRPCGPAQAQREDARARRRASFVLQVVAHTAGELACRHIRACAGRRDAAPPARGHQRREHEHSERRRAAGGARLR